MPPVSESGKVLAELAVSSWAWGADTHARKVSDVRLDTLVHSDATAACIVMGPSGRAEGPVQEDACRREKEEMYIPQLALHCNTSLPDVA